MEFHSIHPGLVGKLRPQLLSHPFRSCDFTVGGIFLWADAFKYEYAIECDTLFIKGVAVNDPTLTAFSLPLGPLPLSQTIEILRDYCRTTDTALTLSSVPEEALPVLIDQGAKMVEPLNDWADYLYEAEALATFAGKKLSKKRNHLNRFAADHPDAQTRPISSADAGELTRFSRACLNFTKVTWPATTGA